METLAGGFGLGWISHVDKCGDVGGGGVCYVLYRARRVYLISIGCVSFGSVRFTWMDGCRMDGQVDEMVFYLGPVKTAAAGWILSYRIVSLVMFFCWQGRRIGRLLFHSSSSGSNSSTVYTHASLIASKAYYL